MEGRRTPTAPVSPLNDHATTNLSSPLHYQAPKGSISPLNSKSTHRRAVSPFYNRTSTPTASVSSSDQNTPKRSASPLHNQTPRGSISPLHSRAPKGSASPVHNQTSKRSISPFLGQRPKGSVSPLHGQATTSSGSSLHALIPKRSPSPLHSQTFTNSGPSLHSITSKRSVSPLLGKSPKVSVSSLYSQNPKGSVSPLHDKASRQSVSPLLGQSSRGLVSPLPSQTPNRSVSPFQHRTPKRSVSPFQHQTPKGSVSPLQSQISERSVSPLPCQTPTISNPPSQSQLKDPSNLVSTQQIQEEIPESSVYPLHDEKKTKEGSVSPLRTKEKPSPNYLKASSGTCHDICKYGGRHEFEEEKGKHVVPKSLKKGKNNGERRKKTIIKLRSLSSGKIVFSEKIEIIVEDSLCSNEEVSKPVEWQDIKSYDDASDLSTEPQNEGESTNSNNSDVDLNLVERRNKKQVLKSKESNEKDAPEKTELNSKKKKDSKKKPYGMKENTSLHEKGATKSDKPKLMEVSDENTRKPVKLKAVVRPTTERNNKIDTQKPVATKVENAPKKKTSFFTLLRSSSGRRSHEGKSEKSVNRQKKTLNTASTSSSSESKEKVLLMVEPKPHKTSSKLSASNSSVEQDTLKAEKSTFRRGKVVETPPDPGTTKKLRFRKGRRSSENLAGFQIGKRSFRRKGSISGGSSNSHGQVVVLRHRETDEKKGIQGLFNSIIEETVNKLVKTRKSKVKALVGAFETVISLQDGKSASVVK
jgi:Plant calmodulin-binding domain